MGAGWRGTHDKTTAATGGKKMKFKVNNAALDTWANLGQKEAKSVGQATEWLMKWTLNQVNS